MTMNDKAGATPYLFEIHHGSTIIRIADDWSGHVLIERIYDGLRHARQSRDAGRVALAPPAPGSDAANAMVEVAMFHGFRQFEGTGTFRATADQIVALMTAAREQGREEILRDIGLQEKEQDS